MRKLAAPLCVLLLACTAGCGIGRQIRHGINCYKTAHYAGAMEIWEELGNCDCDLNHKATVRYLVYRGLTHYHLGETRRAYHFLRKGRQVYLHGSPRWLPRGALREMNAILSRSAGARKITAPPQKYQHNSTVPKNAGARAVNIE